MCCENMMIFFNFPIDSNIYLNFRFPSDAIIEALAKDLYSFCQVFMLLSVVCDYLVIDLICIQAELPIKILRGMWKHQHHFWMKLQVFIAQSLNVVILNKLAASIISQKSHDSLNSEIFIQSFLLRILFEYSLHSFKLLPVFILINYMLFC